LASQPSFKLDTLKEYWPRLESQIHNQRRRKLSKLAQDDPIRSPVDLLSPLRLVSDEVIHTRALAYLCDPAKEHGFEKAVLRSVLTVLAKRNRRKGIAKFLAFLSKSKRIEVRFEYQYAIQGSRTRSSARNDVRIEMRNERSAALIIIENKIEAPEGTHQLALYEDEARKWCKQNNGRSLLVYLGREGREPKDDNDQWLNLSYLSLACALRNAWQKCQETPGGPWLKLYISTITRGLLGVHSKRLEHMNLDQIEDYVWEDTK